MTLGIDELQLFRGQSYKINDNITIRHPTVGEICEYGEHKYYEMISALCATPSDCKVQLWDEYHKDYESVGEFDLFSILSHSFSSSDTKIIFGTLDFQQLRFIENAVAKNIVLADKDGKTVVDEGIYVLMSDYLRTIHGLKKHTDIAGNAHTKQYIIDKERRQMRYNASKPLESMLVPLVSAMVNCEQFKYNHATVWDLPIYTFMDSVGRIQKLKNYDQVMRGVYSGTIDLKSISQENLNWMGSLSKN